MQDILDRAADVTSSRSSINKLRTFLENYGEIKNPQVLKGDDIVLGFSLDNGKYVEIEFSDEGCLPIYSEEDPEFFSPVSMARQLKPHGIPGTNTFELDVLMDSMDVWERQIELGEQMSKIIDRNKLWESAPAESHRLKEIIKEWKKIKRSFGESKKRQETEQNGN